MVAREAIKDQRGSELPKLMLKKNLQNELAELGVFPPN